MLIFLRLDGDGRKVIGMGGRGWGGFGFGEVFSYS